VNSLLGMVTEVSLNPDDRTRVMALIDCAEEEGELAHNAAVRYAVNVRRQAKFNLLCAQAQEIIAIESKYYIDIREHVRDALNLPSRVYICMRLCRTRPVVKMIEHLDLTDEMIGQIGHVNVAIHPAFVLRLREILIQLDQEDREDIDRERRRRRGHRGGQHAPAN